MAARGRLGRRFETRLTSCCQQPLRPPFPRRPPAVAALQAQSSFAIACNCLLAPAPLQLINFLARRQGAPGGGDAPGAGAQASEGTGGMPGELLQPGVVGDILRSFTDHALESTPVPTGLC